MPSVFGARLSRWEAFARDGDDGRIVRVTAIVDTDFGHWSPELASVLAEPLDGLATGVARRAGEFRPFTVDTVVDETAVLTRRYAAEAGAGAAGSSRMRASIGFPARTSTLALRVDACFGTEPPNARDAVDERGDTDPCEGVDAAGFGEPTLAPPSPGPLLASTLTLLRHPRESGAVLGVAVVVLVVELLRSGRRRRKWARKRECSETGKAC